MKKGYLLLLCSLLTSAYMVFHAEGLAGIELHYAAQLTAQSVRGFENCGHHFPAAESGLPAVDEPLTDILFLSSLLLLLCCCTRTLPNRYRLSAGESVIVHALLSLALHMHAMPHPQEICLQ